MIALADLSCAIAIFVESIALARGVEAHNLFSRLAPHSNRDTPGGG